MDCQSLQSANELLGYKGNCVSFTLSFEAILNFSEEFLVCFALEVMSYGELFAHSPRPLVLCTCKVGALS